ncbi:hypothetical protein ZIOFF_017944 [Zingiber officinale]|uniref:Uncharacterized protein n=2 Tax=Zingiber officinale TaxID=94328 RepID=A0A8J5H665_ZINOF|nr:hypothetical protein ZIOFF_017944 [Zingiber officinale]
MVVSSLDARYEDLRFGLLLLVNRLKLMEANEDEISVLFTEINDSHESSFEFSDDIISLPPEMLKSNEKTIVLTPEEATWVDSCFAFGPESSDDKWMVLRDAFLDALNSYPIYHETPPSVIESNDDRVLVDTNKAIEQHDVMDDDLPEEMQTEHATFIDKTSHLTIMKVQDDHIIHHNPSTDAENSSDQVSTAEEVTESRESVFKVWDLETSAEEEEDELITQLNKLLSGSRLQQPMHSSLYVSEENVDELIASFFDLSLKPFEDE